LSPVIFAIVAALSAPAAFAAPPAHITESVANPYQLIRSTMPATHELTESRWYPEVLEYELKWGILSVGSANLKTAQVEDFNGTAAVHVVSEANSNKFCDGFYKVRDLNESWLHAREFYSLGYSKKLREGSFFRDEWVLYDYPRKAFLSKTTNKDGSSSFKKGDIPGPVQDILSSMYYIRNKPLKVGDQIQLVANTRENWPLVIKVLYRTHIDVPAGRFETIVVEPFLLKEGIFVQKGRHLQIWMTNDARHVPVAMSVEVFFGHVSAQLTKLNGEAHPPPPPGSEMGN